MVYAHEYGLRGGVRSSGAESQWEASKDPWRASALNCSTAFCPCHKILMKDPLLSVTAAGNDPQEHPAPMHEASTRRSCRKWSLSFPVWGDREATALILGSVLITTAGNAFWGLAVVCGGSQSVALADLEFSIYEERSACVRPLSSLAIFKACVTMPTTINL